MTSETLSPPGGVRVIRALRAAVLALGVLVAGCTADDPPPVPVPSPTTAPEPVVTSPVEEPVDPDERWAAALLTPADAGEGYTLGSPPPADAPEPAACGGDGVVTRFPDAERVAVALEHSGEGAAVQQTLAVYPDPATAQAAFDAGAAGFACASGTLGAVPVRISEPADLRADVGGDRALGWQLGADGVEVLVVSVQAAEAVVTFAYAAPSGTAIEQRPDALGLTRTGVERLLTA